MPCRGDGTREPHPHPRGCSAPSNPSNPSNLDALGVGPAQAQRTHARRKPPLRPYAALVWTGHRRPALGTAGASGAARCRLVVVSGASRSVVGPLALDTHIELVNERTRVLRTCVRTNGCSSYVVSTDRLVCRTSYVSRCVTSSPHRGVGTTRCERKGVAQTTVTWQ